MDYQNELALEVRDYECDLQGVVNNAVYQHYLEHARHKWMESLGVDFGVLHKEGVDLVVVRIEIDYKYPLRSRDRFAVRSNLQKEGRLRIICSQDIYRLPDDRLIARAKVIVTGLQNGRPFVPPIISEKIEGLPKMPQG
ncbi:MAG: acyl-CoA thioesterase [Spirochaetia bacterium]